VLTVFGSTALDTIRTPSKTLKDVLGGAATFAGLASSFFIKTGLIAVAIVGSKSLTGSNVKEFVKDNRGKYIILDYECRGNVKSCDPYVYYRLIKFVKPNETVTLPPATAVYYSDPFQYIINNVPNVYLMEYDEDSSIFSMYRDCHMMKNPKFYLYARDIDFILRLYIAKSCGAKITIWT